MRINNELLKILLFFFDFIPAKNFILLSFKHFLDRYKRVTEFLDFNNYPLFSNDAIPKYTLF